MRELRADVVVVGAGPAGLAAAAAAASDGAQVLVADASQDFGGQIWRATAGARPPPRALALREQVERHGGRILQGTTVFDVPAPGRLHALVAGGAGETTSAVALRAGRTVLACGASELFLPFPGWTLPGVFGAGGLQALVKGGLPIAGRRVVVAGSGPLLLAVAASLRRAGATLVGIFEQAARRRVLRLGLGLARAPRKLGQALALLRELRGVPRHYDAWAIEAQGRDRLERLSLSVAGSLHTVEAELLACSFGLVPDTRLASLAGCALDSGRVVVDALQRTTVPGVWCAGEATGIGGVELALAEGAVAGHAAAGRDELARAGVARLRRERRFAFALERAFALRKELRSLPRADTIVCRCEDVRCGALDEHDDPRQAKLETRLGMGLCQGRICGPALGFLRGWPAGRVRPPIVPVPAGLLAERGPADPPSA